MVSRKSDVAVVTSCSKQGWELYGKHCFPTLLQHWPEDIKIYLISEDVLPLGNLPLLAKGRLKAWSLSDSFHERAFREKFKFDARVRGKKTRNQYSYIFDAWKFSKKVFAINLAASNITAGRLIWLDADVQTLKPIPRDVLTQLCPDNCNLSYLGRRGLHSECGFVGYNLNNPGTYQFIDKFASAYSTGHVFRLKEWHDSWVFDWLRHEMPDLVGYAIPHTNPLHPFNYSELGQYMDHWKGKRKQQGCSPDHPRFKLKTKRR